MQEVHNHLNKDNRVTMQAKRDMKCNEPLNLANTGEERFGWQRLGLVNFANGIW